MKLRVPGLIAVPLLICAAASNAQAAFVNWEFIGTIGLVGGAGVDINQRDRFNISVRFDTTTAGTGQSPVSNGSGSFKINGRVVELINDGTSDEGRVSSGSRQYDFTNAFLNPEPYQEYYFDTVSIIFNSTMLSDNLYQTGTFTSNNSSFGSYQVLQISNRPGGIERQYGAQLNLDKLVVTSDVVSAVPLPASAPMFGAALLGLAGLGYAANRKKVASTA